MDIIEKKDHYRGYDILGTEQSYHDGNKKHSELRWEIHKDSVYVLGSFNSIDGENFKGLNNCVNDAKKHIDAFYRMNAFYIQRAILELQFRIQNPHKFGKLPRDKWG